MPPFSVLHPHTSILRAFLNPGVYSFKPPNHPSKTLKTQTPNHSLELNGSSFSSNPRHKLPCPLPRLSTLLCSPPSRPIAPFRGRRPRIPFRHLSSREPLHPTRPRHHTHRLRHARTCRLSTLSPPPFPPNPHTRQSLCRIGRTPPSHNRLYDRRS